MVLIVVLLYLSLQSLLDVLVVCTNVVVIVHRRHLVADADGH